MSLNISRLGGFALNHVEPSDGPDPSSQTSQSKPLAPEASGAV